MKEDLIREIVSVAARGEPLTREQATAAMRAMMSGWVSPELTASLLTALRVRGETPAELAGFATVMRETAVTIKPRRRRFVDTCGTGGGAIPTFNISTTAAFVVAGAGVGVAKHGNRGMTSPCGSADVLEALGVRIDCEPERIADCVDRCGVGFMFAQAHHPAMRFVAPVRRELPFRTVFNLLGPLANPAGATRQVIGVFEAPAADLLAEALREMGHERAIVAHGIGGLDELSTLGPTRIVDLRGGELHRYEVQPEEVGLDRAEPAALAPGSSVAEAAAILVRVLEGEPGPRRDIVLLNAAAALVVADAAAELGDAVALARESIDSGAAMRALNHLREESQPSQ